MNLLEKSKIEKERWNIYNIAQTWRESFFLLGDISSENIEEKKVALYNLGKKIINKMIYGGFSAYEVYVNYLNWLMDYGDLYEEDFKLVKNTAFKKSVKMIKCQPLLIKDMVGYYNHIEDELRTRELKKGNNKEVVNIPQHHRRFENHNTIKDRLKEWFDIEVNLEKEEEEEQYKRLCNEMEKIEYDFSSDKKSDDNPNTRKHWNIRFGDIFQKNERKKDRIPLDLLEPTMGERDIYGKKYRPFIQRFLKQLFFLTNKESRYNYCLQIFCEIYTRIIIQAEQILLGSSRIEKDIEKYKRHIMQLCAASPLNCYQLPPNEDDLWSRVLLELCKIAIINKIRRHKYVYDHTKIFSEIQPLSENAHQIFLTMVAKDIKIPDGECQRKILEDLILKTYKKEISILLDKEAIVPIFKSSFKLVKAFRLNIEYFAQFISLMICCNYQQECKLDIIHFGLPRGKISISLKRIIKEANTYQCIEVALFLDILMKRVFLVNQYGQEKADQLFDFLLFMDEQLKTDIQHSSSWQELYCRFYEMSRIYKLNI